MSRQNKLVFLEVMLEVYVHVSGKSQNEMIVGKVFCTHSIVILYLFLSLVNRGNLKLK